MKQDPTAINGFHSLNGQHQFLSNFYRWTFTLAHQRADSPVAHLAGLSAPTAEHFFQAAKTLSPTEAQRVLQVETPAGAKRFGRQVRLRPDWEQVKDRAMAEILRSKFGDPFLRVWLLETGDREIIEANHWHDVVWGTCTCGRHQGQGENRLGRTLMELRREIAADTADHLRRETPAAPVENGFWNL